MINYLIPFEGIGDFKIRDKIFNYKNDFKYTPPDEVTSWETYEILDKGLSLYVENDIIISIACDSDCLFKGRNIIGLNIDEFITYYEITPEEDIDSCLIENDVRQDIYEFDSIGIQVWCKDNKIDTIIVYSGNGSD